MGSDLEQKLAKETKGSVRVEAVRTGAGWGRIFEQKLTKETKGSVSRVRYLRTILSGRARSLMPVLMRDSVWRKTHNNVLVWTT